MAKLQIELKKVTRLAQQTSALSTHIKGLIMANREMDLISCFMSLTLSRK
jgi:hypothetical protein